jgi:hypothetical protein
MGFGGAMKYFSVKTTFNDCHGAYRPSELEYSEFEEWFYELDIEIIRFKDIDGRYSHGGGRNLDRVLESWQKARNGVLHYADDVGKYNSIETAITWDIETRLYRLSDEQWAVAYKRFQEAGIHREYELTTYYDRTPYTSILLEPTNDCDD